jgi:hypothetical protein
MPPTITEDKGADGADKGQGGTNEGDADVKLANLVNAAVGNHLKRVLPKALAENLDVALKPVREQLAGLAPPKAEPPAGGDKGAPDTKYAEMERKIAEQGKRLAESEARREASEKAARETKAFAHLRGELAGKVRADGLDAAVKLLKADGRVRANDDGDAVFVDGEDEIPLQDGLKKWLKSSEGQIFAPAPTGQNGARNGGKFTPRRGPDGKTIAETSDERAARLLSKQGISLAR